MLKYQNSSEKGFIALTSTIIIVLVLVTITVIVSISGFLGRFNILDGEFKEISVGLAEACVETAIIKIVQNASYSPPVGGECVPIGDTCPSGNNTCTIVSVSGSVIKTQGVFKESYTNLKVTIDTDFMVTSWEECTNFTSSPTSC